MAVSVTSSSSRRPVIPISTRRRSRRCAAGASSPRAAATIQWPCGCCCPSSSRSDRGDAHAPRHARILCRRDRDGRGGHVTLAAQSHGGERGRPGCRPRPASPVHAPGKGHEIHLSGVSVAAAPDGGALVTWGAEEKAANQIYVARFGTGETKPVRVNPDDLSMEALHHPPRLVLGPAGEIYLSWSSAKPIPEGALFASDLRLSRSVDGGKSFVGHLRVNEDRPISHSFDGLAVASDGTVLVSWLDSRAGGPNAGTYLARVVDGGTRVDGITRVGENACVCCRVDAAAGPAETVTIIWRKVFPGDIRDMVLSTS